MNERTKPQESAGAGPGGIAARQADPPNRPADAVPPMPQSRAGTPVVGTPGASDQANPAPGAEGLAGEVTNNQMLRGNTDDVERTPPDMEEEMPDPRGDARDAPPPR